MDKKTMDMIKVGVACFIGAIALYVAALFLAPAFKFLCLLAGFGAGYFAYEFRKVLVAIPGALRAAWKTTKHMLLTLLEIRNLLPKITPWIWVGAIGGFSAADAYGSIIRMNEVSEAFGSVGYLSMLLIMATAWIVGFSMFSAILYNLYEYGLYQRKIKFADRYEEEHDDPYRRHAYNREKKWDNAHGYVYLDFDALSFEARWKLFGQGLWAGTIRLIFAFGRGIEYLFVGLFTIIGAILKFLFWTMWKGLAYAVAWVVMFITETTVNVVLAVHKKERLICGLDGMIGGAVAWIHLAPIAATSSAEHVLPAVCGGILGALFGMVNYRLVSVTLLKFLPVHQPQEN